MKVRLEVIESLGKLSLLVPDDVVVAMSLRPGDRVDVDLHGKPIALRDPSDQDFVRGRLCRTQWRSRRVGRSNPT